LSARGPYVNENTYQVAYPVADWTYADARRAAASFAREESGACIGRSRFLGKREFTGHECPGWEEIDGGSCECKPEPMYLFETYER
jgi:hypothetical protein